MDRYTRWAATTMAIGLAGLFACGDNTNLPTEAQAPKFSPTKPHFEEWPDSAAYVEAGIQVGSLSLTSSGSFAGDFSSYSASGSLHFTWANDVALSEVGTLINNSHAVINSHPPASVHKELFVLPVSSGDTTISTGAIGTLGRTCGLTGQNTASGTVQQIVKSPSTSFAVTMWQSSGDRPGDDNSEPACPLPKARVSLGYGGRSGQDISITLPSGETATVSVDGSGSAKQDAGAADISSYAWTVGGSLFSTSSSFTLSVGGGSSSATANLAATDGDGFMGSASGSVAIEYFDPCDDPMTITVESCLDNPPSSGESTSMDGGSQDPGIYHSGTLTDKWVCYVHDWYEWNGSAWVYDTTDLDYCDLES